MYLDDTSLENIPGVVLLSKQNKKTLYKVPNLRATCW